MLTATQPDWADERGEFDGAGLRARNAEEGLVRFGVQVHVVLRCAAVGGSGSRKHRHRPDHRPCETPATVAAGE